MAKETFYFSHDYNARGDRKMVNLLMTVGIEGIGIYWCIVEMLYEEGGYLMRTECERIAFELRTHSERIEQVINSTLFKNDDEKFWSESVLQRIEIRRIKSEKARESANYRHANAMRTHNNGNAININRNAIKESKEKENKGISFNEEKNAVYFGDGSMQKLGKNQLFRITQDDLKPSQVLKGLVT